MAAQRACFFSCSVVRNRLSILAIWSQTKVWFLHSSLDLFFEKKLLSFITVDKTWYAITLFKAKSAIFPSPFKARLLNHYIPCFRPALTSAWTAGYWFKSLVLERVGKIGELTLNRVRVLGGGPYNPTQDSVMGVPPPPPPSWGSQIKAVLCPCWIVIK